MVISLVFVGVSVFISAVESCVVSDQRNIHDSCLCPVPMSRPTSSLIEVDFPEPV